MAGLSPPPLRLQAECKLKRPDKPARLDWDLHPTCPKCRALAGGDVRALEARKERVGG